MWANNEINRSLLGNTYGKDYATIKKIHNPKYKTLQAKIPKNKPKN